MHRRGHVHEYAFSITSLALHVPNVPTRHVGSVLLLTVANDHVDDMSVLMNDMNDDVETSFAARCAVL